MQPLHELRATAEVLQRLGFVRKLNPATAQCIDGAFDGIRQGTLSLTYFGIEPNLFFTNACGFAMLVSVLDLTSDAGPTGVVVGLFPGSQDLLA